MSKAVLYIHGKGGSAAEAEHYIPLFPGRDVLGFDYKAGTPWEAKEEFSSYFKVLSHQYESIVLIANSIGAYFAMAAELEPEKAYFISPVVHMEKLIRDMMSWAGVTEEELKEKKEIGELSWEYLCYTREHPVKWTVPTHILYGERDELTAMDTISSFAEEVGATLDVMSGGEHWFHAEAQMAFLDDQIKKYERR